MVGEAKKSGGFSIYGGEDPADLPRYTYADAARATDVPASTIGVWFRGMPYTVSKGERRFFHPVIARPDANDTRLSFNNLLEVNILRALRQVHDVRLQTVRDAIQKASQELGIERLLIHPDLRTTEGRLFLDHYFQLVELTNTQQLAMEVILRHSLQRVQADHSRISSFYPIPRSGSQDARPIMVSPYVAFGNAIIERCGISTAAIRARFDAGEPKADIVADYGLTPGEFDEAILYEAAA
jgi:uncharacterized protein (DUF433 family)